MIGLGVYRREGRRGEGEGGERGRVIGLGVYRREVGRDWLRREEVRRDKRTREVSLFQLSWQLHVLTHTCTSRYEYDSTAVEFVAAFCIQHHI